MGSQTLTCFVLKHSMTGSSITVVEYTIIFFFLKYRFKTKKSQQEETEQASVTRNN